MNTTKILPLLDVLRQQTGISVEIQGGKWYDNFNEVLQEIVDNCKKFDSEKERDIEYFFMDYMKNVRVKETQFTSLKGIDYFCDILTLNDNTSLRSFEGLKKSTSIRSIHLHNQYFFNIHNSHKILSNDLKDIQVFNTPIIGGLLSLLMLSEFKTLGSSLINLDFKVARNIINKHLQGDRDLLDCQEEMVQAGLKEFAKI